MVVEAEGGSVVLPGLRSTWGGQYMRRVCSGRGSVGPSVHL